MKILEKSQKMTRDKTHRRSAHITDVIIIGYVVVSGRTLSECPYATTTPLSIRQVNNIATMEKAGWYKCKGKKEKEGGRLSFYFLP